MIIIISLILSAFFSGMEIAYVSSDKLNLEIQKKRRTIENEIEKEIQKAFQTLSDPNERSKYDRKF